MSILADPYETVQTTGRKQARLLPAYYLDAHARLPSGGQTPAPPSRPEMSLREEEAHAFVRQALIEQKTLVIKMADNLSSIVFSGNGNSLKVEHLFARGHRAVYPLCIASWIIWETYQGCPSRTLNELLAFIPDESARPPF